MKKIILLLVLPFTILMAIDFTMTEKGLFTETTTQSPAPGTDTGATSPYLEPVNLPECDANNPEVQFIRNNADWNTINSSSKRIFCVSPGDYTSLKNITLTTSGTAEKRRYIVLNNGNDIHPGKLKKSEIANFALELKSASYWTIDRAASFNVSLSHSFLVGQKSTNNIFNRLFTQNIFHTMWVRKDAHYNTIQNSRFDGITKSGAEADLAAVNILDWDKFFTIYGTKVINNEFINCKAVRINRKPEQDQFAYFDGTIVDNNTIEFDDTIRTDCKGNFDPNGNCMYGEGTGFGVKSGTSDSTKPILFTNNKVWGYRPADPTIPHLSNKGTAITAYYGVHNVHIKNNVIFDGTYGIVIADRFNTEAGTYDAVIEDNIIVDCGERPNASGATSLNISQAIGATARNNFIKNPLGYYSKVHYNYRNNTYAENVIVNKSLDMKYIGNHEPVNGLTTNEIYNTAEEAGYTEDYRFTANRFTNSPRVITLENVVKPN